MITLNEGEHEITVKRSRFIAISRRIDSRDSAKAFKDELKKRHFEARHVCLGYIADDAGDDYGYDDDGEPTGTAGKPIYQALAAAGVGRSAIAVVRYFGGILLGAGGLTRAYRTAAGELVASAGTTELLPYTAYSVRASGEVYKRILPTLRNLLCLAPEILYNNGVTLTALAPSGVQLETALANSGADVTRLETRYLTRTEADNVNKIR